MFFSVRSTIPPAKLLLFFDIRKKKVKIFGTRSDRTPSWG